jgi:hypothetical protein
MLIIEKDVKEYRKEKMKSGFKSITTKPQTNKPEKIFSIIPDFLGGGMQKESALQKDDSERIKKAQEMSKEAEKNTEEYIYILDMIQNGEDKIKILETIGRTDKLTTEGRERLIELIEEKNKEVSDET